MRRKTAITVIMVAHLKHRNSSQKVLVFTSRSSHES
jgi:hypothetical protein